MTELKTLKDIEKCPDCKAIGKPKCVQYLEAKQEAIKWVKENSLYSNHPLYKRWLKFFNITKEDLK